MPSTTPLRLAVAGLSSLVCLLTLTACGSGTSSDGVRVASRPTASSGSSVTATDGTTTGGATTATGGRQTNAADASRPQERLDDTPAERDRLIGAWDDCLLAHGAHSGGGPGASGPGTTEALATV